MNKKIKYNFLISRFNSSKTKALVNQKGSDIEDAIIDLGVVFISLTSEQFHKHGLT